MFVNKKRENLILGDWSPQASYSEHKHLLVSLGDASLEGTSQPGKTQALPVMAKFARAGGGRNTGSVWALLPSLLWEVSVGPLSGDKRVTHFHKSSVICTKCELLSSDWHVPSSHLGDTMTRGQNG